MSALALLLWMTLGVGRKCGELETTVLVSGRCWWVGRKWLGGGGLNIAPFSRD